MKTLYLVLGLCLLAAGYYFFRLPSAPPEGYCPFCDPQVIERQSFYEDDLAIALYSHKPIVPGHCLIIPKRHVERFEMTTEQEASRLCDVIKKVNPAAMKVFGTVSYLLLQKNGHESGQTVPHVHFHYIPKQAGDSSWFKFIVKMYIAILKKPISSSEMEEVVEKMRQAI